jgi:hypothetical protein
MIRAALLTALLLLLAACSGEKPVEPPARITTAPVFAEQTSSAVLPVRIPLSQLEQMVNKEIPQTLWTIDRKEDKCVPGQRITICPAPKRECKNGKCKMVGCNFGLYRTKITPDFSCRIIGQVTRGRIRLSGRGDQVMMVMPISATLGARKVAGVLKETATAAADVRMRVRLDVGQNWQPLARVEIDHDWREPPGIDFMGKRISFASKADPALQKAFADIERRIRADVAKMPMKARVNEGWKAGFTVIELNRLKPPAFMRVTPRRVSFGGFRVRNRQLELRIGMMAVTETFVGDRPAPLLPTPLPPPDKTFAPEGLAFNIPVLADYDELVPVVDRTLAKLAKRGVTVPKLGKVELAFRSVTIHATEGGRLAIGIPASARLKINPFRPTKGIVWLTGRPVNTPGSQRIEVEDLRIFGETDRETVNLLLRVFEDPEVLAEVQSALHHDFAPDYERVLKAARAAIASRRFGPFMLRATATDVRNGQILVTGKGLFMPVTVRGTASLSFAPARPNTTSISQ